MGLRSRAGVPVLGALLAAAVASGAGAAAARAVPLETAPGRVLFAVAGGRASLIAGAPLPGGGALLAGAVPHSGRVYIAKVSSTGELEPSFGDEGIATVDARLAFEQILVQPDGRILLIGRESPTGFISTLPWGEKHLPLVAVRLNADGTLDSTYGSGGTAAAGIEGGCQCENVAVLGADGSLTLTGQREAKVRHPWGTETTTQWALARLTAAGTPDPSFGTDGTALVPGEEGVGLSLEAGPGGSLIAQGQERVTEKEPGGGGATGPANLMTRITSTGAVDPAYGGGNPFKLPTFSIDDSYGQVPEPLEASADPDGSVVVETVVPGNGAQPSRRPGFGLVAYDASGAIDPSFAQRGYLNFEEQREETGSLLLREPDESIMALHGQRVGPAPPTRVGSTGGELAEPAFIGSVLEAERISPAGAFDLSFSEPPGRAATIAFGGGGSEQLPDIHDPIGEATQAFEANSFLEGPGLVALPLADGSLLLAGNVSLAGPASGTSNRFALALLSPSFTLDPAAGAPARAPSVALAASHPLSRRAVSRVRVPFFVESSGPGLARVELFAGRRLIARRVVALLDSARRLLVLQVPSSGRQFVRGHPRARLRATVSFRDLFGQETSAALTVRR